MWELSGQLLLLGSFRLLHEGADLAVEPRINLRVPALLAVTDDALVVE